MGVIITRFAPAPTGFLHLGHIVNAAYVWGVARACGGRVLLRLEDHDRRRSRPEFDAEILRDLAWLGFVADEGPVRQSGRGDVYTQALATLRRQGLVYGCACSRADIAGPSITHAAAIAQAEDERRYPGLCRDRGRAEGLGVGLRVRLEPSVECFVDLRHGPQEQCPAEQCGDVLARDRDGHWTYQFAAAVDDFAQGVTLVVRGDDLLASTGRQLQLARLLGRTDTPQFLHHPLIMKSAGPNPQKLSKSDGDTGIRDLRARGWTPAQVIGHAAALAGLVAEGRDVRADEVSSIMSGFNEVLR
jgi:glutamyl/glutaminyl-tRNA synthetase